MFVCLEDVFAHCGRFDLDLKQCHCLPTRLMTNEMFDITLCSCTPSNIMLVVGVVVDNDMFEIEIESTTMLKHISQHTNKHFLFLSFLPSPSSTGSPTQFIWAHRCHRWGGGNYPMPHPLLLLLPPSSVLPPRPRLIVAIPNGHLFGFGHPTRHFDVIRRLRNGLL